MEEEDHLVRHHGSLCVPASLPAARRTSSADQVSVMRGSCSGMPCGCPSSSSACQIRQSKCPRATPSSGSTSQRQWPSPGSPGPVSGSVSSSETQPGSLSFLHVVDPTGPAPVAAQKVPGPSPAVRSARSRLSPKLLIAVRNYESSSSSSELTLLDHLAGELFSGGHVYCY